MLLLALVAGACQARPSARRDAGEAAAGAADGGVIGPVTHVLPPAVSPSRLLPEPEVPMPSQRRFALLEPGATPRRALRYRAGGPARELVATARIVSKAYADGTWTEELALAPVRDGFGVTTEAAGAGLVVHVRGLVGEIDAGASAAATTAAGGYLTRWRALLERRRADVAIDERGQLDTVTILDDPAGHGGREVRDELVQRWLGIAVPLPAEPIGAGARWKVVTLLRTGGAVLKQTATYRLVEATADRWTIAVELERLGEHQDIVVPGLPAGSQAELLALRRVVTGTLTVGPDGPLPVGGELTVDSASHARFTIAGQPAREQATEDRATVTLSTR